MNAKQTQAALENWLQENEASSILCLNDVDREFFRQCGIGVEDAAWPLDDEKLTYDEALVVLDRSMKRKQQKTICYIDLTEPEAV